MLPRVFHSQCKATGRCERAGGSCVGIQKYLHDLKALPAEIQEAIVGRTEVEYVELDDAPSPNPHKSRVVVVDEQGNEHDVLRENMLYLEY